MGESGYNFHIFGSGSFETKKLLRINLDPKQWASLHISIIHCQFCSVVLGALADKIREAWRRVDNRERKWT